MIKALVFAAVMAVPAFANAQGASRDCEEFGAMAETIMTARQNNVPMSRLMALADQSAAAELIRLVVLHAYQQPLYVSEEFKREAIASFRNEAEAACYGVRS